MQLLHQLLLLLLSQAAHPGQMLQGMTKSSTWWLLVSESRQGWHSHMMPSLQ
jgi:hypothetical protein